MPRRHACQVSVAWTGNQGPGTSSYRESELTVLGEDSWQCLGVGARLRHGVFEVTVHRSGP